MQGSENILGPINNAAETLLINVWCSFYNHLFWAIKKLGYHKLTDVWQPH